MLSTRTCLFPLSTTHFYPIHKPPVDADTAWHQFVAGVAVRVQRAATYKTKNLIREANNLPPCLGTFSIDSETKGKIDLGGICWHVPSVIT